MKEKIGATGGRIQEEIILEHTADDMTSIEYIVWCSVAGYLTKYSVLRTSSS